MGGRGRDRRGAEGRVGGEGRERAAREWSGAGAGGERSWAERRGAGKGGKGRGRVGRGGEGWGRVGGAGGPPSARARPRSPPHPPPPRPPRPPPRRSPLPRRPRSALPHPEISETRQNCTSSLALASSIHVTYHTIIIKYKAEAISLYSHEPILTGPPVSYCHWPTLTSHRPSVSAARGAAAGAARGWTGGVDELLGAQREEGRGNRIVMRVHNRSEVQREVLLQIVAAALVRVQFSFIVLIGSSLDCEEDCAAGEGHVHLG